MKQIADAGYGARKEDIRIVLTGKVIRENDQLFFLAEDLKPASQKFSLLKGVSKNEKEAKLWSEAFEKAGSSLGETVEIEGYWKAADTKKDKSAKASLSLIRIKPLKPEEKNEGKTEEKKTEDKT